MKILYLITRADLGGAQTHLIDLLKGFQHECELVVGTGEEGYLTDVCRNLGVEVRVLSHLVQPMSLVEDLRALAEVRALIEDVRPDLVHTHTSKAGVIGRFAAKMAGVPSTFTAHTWSFAEGTSLKWKLVGVPLEKLAALCTPRMIAVSDANRDLALNKGITSGDRLVTVHNGIDDVDARADPGTGNPPRMVMVARFAEQKNQRVLLQVAAQIIAPFQLVLVGDGPTRASIEAEAEQLGIRGQIEFLGQRTDIAEILASCQIFLLPTNWEGFPISILEGMRAGLPVIANDVGGCREAVQDGVTGLLIPRGDCAALGEGITKLLVDPALRQRMGSAGRRSYEAEFTRDAMIRKTRRVYLDVIGRPEEVVGKSGIAADGNG